MSAILKRFDFLDQLEILEARGYQADFPSHLHEQLCLTLTTQGVECTQVNNQELISPFQGISLTYADEIHANPNKNNGSYSFLTYYISPDVIRYFSGYQSCFFRDRIILNAHLYRELFKYGGSSNQSEEKFGDILRYLIQHYQINSKNHTIGEKMEKLDFSEVVSYIEYHFADPISIQFLARMKGLNRFSFIRNFKQFKGITPAQYVTLKRIEAVKKMLRKGEPIIEAALKSGFYDQSHMSRNFKKITGITPRSYQRARNIIQEL